MNNISNGITAFLSLFSISLKWLSEMFGFFTNEHLQAMVYWLTIFWIIGQMIIHRKNLWNEIKKVFK
jgi:heme/copper-type cytochrome/quinol oxidase subunit 1